jgi:hypothetical protein
MDTKTMIIIGIILILAIFLLSTITGGDQMGLLEFVMIASLILIFVIFGMQYYNGVDMKASLPNIFKPELDITVSSDKEEKQEEKEVQTQKETYHVTGQFDYTNAKNMCRAYGGQLASIQNLTDAFNKGGEWCNYGWSDDGMALYPTQYSTWEKLKESGRAEECGRPGVNGGYINNPSQKLGINCYGLKPAPPTDFKPTVFPPLPTPPTLDLTMTNSVTPFNYTQWNN